MSKRFVNTAGCSFVLFLYNLSFFAGSGKLLVVVIVTCPDSQSADRFIAVVSKDIYSLNGFMKSIFFMVHLKRKIVLIVQCTMTLWCTRVLKVVAVHQLVESWSLSLGQRVIGQSHRSTCFLFLWSSITQWNDFCWIPFFQMICYIFHEITLWNCDCVLVNSRIGPFCCGIHCTNYLFT